VRITGCGRAPENFDDFDYRGYLARQGIFATMIVDSPAGVQQLGAAGGSVMRLGDRIRQLFLSRIDALLPPEEAALAHGLLFGERGMMPEDAEEAFRRAGLMHLLAVSGLHLGIFLAGLWFLLRSFGLRPRIAYPLVGIAVLFVLWIVGLVNSFNMLDNMDGLSAGVAAIAAAIKALEVFRSIHRVGVDEVREMREEGRQY
jgi:competence protein ComEC